MALQTPRITNARNLLTALLETCQNQPFTATVLQERFENKGKPFTREEEDHLIDEGNEYLLHRLCVNDYEKQLGIYKIHPDGKYDDIDKIKKSSAMVGLKLPLTYEEKMAQKAQEEKKNAETNNSQKEN